MSKKIPSKISPWLQAKLKNLRCKNSEDMLEYLTKEEIFELFVTLTRNHRLLKETNKYNAEVATNAHQTLQRIDREAQRPSELWEDDLDKIIDMKSALYEGLDKVNGIRTRQRLVIEARQEKESE